MKEIKDLVVVELTTFVAATTAGHILSTLGAKVIRVESLAGDPWRYYGPGMCCPADPEENPVFDIVNGLKDSVSINLKSDEGMEAMLKLLSKADIFITSNREDALKRMALDYDTLSKKFPTLIFASVSGYGSVGPDCKKPGFDPVAFWAHVGPMCDLTWSDSAPTCTPAGSADLSVGTYLYGAIMTALYNREITGKGDHVSNSIYGTGIWQTGIMVLTAQERYGNPYPRVRRETNPLMIAYRCADGEWILPNVMEYDRHFPIICDVLGIEELKSDPRYATKGDMLANPEFLVDTLDEVFAKKTSEEWDKLLTEADIAHDILGHFKNVTKDEQAIVNGYVSECPVRGGKEKSMMLAPPMHYKEIETIGPKIAGALGKDTRDVLVGFAGCDADWVDEMIAKGEFKQA